VVVPTAVDVKAIEVAEVAIADLTHCVVARVVELSDVAGGVAEHD